MRTAKRITYFESNDYEGFEAYMADEFHYNETPITEKGTNEYFERFANWESMYWDDFMANLKYSTSNKDCVVVGSVGLWNGRRDIKPKRFDTLIDAINACVSGGYDMHINIYKVNGHLEVSIAHHDGTHYFEIYLLNDKGVRASERADLSNRCYYKAMEKYLY